MNDSFAPGSLLRLGMGSIQALFIAFLREVGDVPPTQKAAANTAIYMYPLVLEMGIRKLVLMAHIHCTTRITRDESFYNHHRTRITHATNYVYQLRSSSSYAPPTEWPQPHCLYGDTLNKADVVARGPADMSYILFMVGLTAAV